MVEIKRHRPKNGQARFITIKCRKQNLVSYVDDQELLMKDPNKASEMALRKHQKSYGLRYDPNLMTIACYPNGHYLVYDNSEIIAYTVVVADCQ